RLWLEKTAFERKALFRSGKTRQRLEAPLPFHHLRISADVDSGFTGVARHSVGADIGNCRLLADQPLGLGQLMLKQCKARSRLPLIHDLRFIAELPQATSPLAQSENRHRQAVPHPEQPLANSMLIGRTPAIELLQDFGKIFKDRRRLAEKNLTVAQAGNLSIAVLDKVVRLFVGAFAEIDM